MITTGYIIFFLPIFIVYSVVQGMWGDGRALWMAAIFALIWAGVCF